MSVNLFRMTLYQLCPGRSRPLLAASALFGLLTTPLPATGQETRIELYTVGPGDYLFSKFGHAALCVSDADWPGGLCFNYGTADFSTPGPLTWAVVRGRAVFWVSVAPLQEMLVLYRAEDRTIYRQALPLTENQAADLKRALATSALPENRYYLYDHFQDNCSTRPRDHIDDATGGALRKRAERGGRTFRELVGESLQDDPIFFFLAELILGRSMDRMRSEYEAMFLPQFLRHGVERHLRVTQEVVYARRAAVPAMPSPLVAHRLALALGFGLAIGLITLTSTPRIYFGVRRLFGFLFGSLGSLLVALAAISPLAELRYNELLLVFLPTDLFLLLAGHRWHRALSVYLTLRVAGLLLVGALRWSGVLLQPLWPYWGLTLFVLGAVRARAVAPSPSPALE